MNTKRKQSGITLMEMTVVVAAVALLAVLGLPAISAFVNSLVSSGPTKAMISAALSSARAIAVKERHYAGIRFQKAYDPKGLLEAPQYMVFIVQDPEIMAYGFRAVEGLEPIRLPDSVGMMDLMIVPARNTVNPVNPSGQSEIDRDDRINDSFELLDTTTFSIIFSPTGKLVVHGVCVRNRDGYTASNDTSKDDIFNTLYNVETARIAMFLQDDYWTDPTNFGLGPEPSRNSFIIYERDKFRAAFEKGRAWTDYLKNLDAIYINPYVGTIIEK